VLSSRLRMPFMSLSLLASRRGLVRALQPSENARLCRLASVASRQGLVRALQPSENARLCRLASSRTPSDASKLRSTVRSMKRPSVTRSPPNAMTKVLPRKA